MRSVVHAPQPAAVDVAVDLRRRERAVAEELLDRAQVGAALEEMRGEGVAKAVRVGREPPQRARVEAPSPCREEESVFRAAGQRRPGLAQIAREPVRGLLAERHGSLLASLAADADELLLELHVGEVEGDRFRAPQSGGVDELDEGAVSQRQRTVPLERVEENLDLSALRRLGQPASAARCEGGFGYPRGAERGAQERTYRGELAGDRRRRQAPRRAARPRRSELRHVLGEDADVDVAEPDRPALEPARELLDVGPVGAPGRTG